MHQMVNNKKKIDTICTLHMAACRTMMRSMMAVVHARKADVVAESKDSSDQHDGEGRDKELL
jgi:hypothetical protein